MFGLLLAEDRSGRTHWLKAFSGMLKGQWHVEGFVPPVFEAAKREAVEGPYEEKVQACFERTQALKQSPEKQSLEAQLAALKSTHLEEERRFQSECEAKKRARHARRAQGVSDELLKQLSEESRTDKAHKKLLEKAHRLKEEACRRQLQVWQRKIAASERLHRFVCQKAMRAIFDTYSVRNFQQESRRLTDLFHGVQPPSGAGDCAAIKLLAEAQRQQLSPRCLVEFFWGSPPLSGSRLPGHFYAPCKEKCGPILEFMLQGLAVSEEAPLLPKKPTGKAAFRVVYQDDWLVVVDKPPQVLSVPGKYTQDSVLTRLQEMFPHAEGPLLVHRLDMETSGLLLAALHPEVHTHLQKQFLRRTVEKKYIAWVERELEENSGRIELALRLDPQDRPRQIFDPTFGKPAITEWKTTVCEPGRTRVEFFPRTGRTHQLRVHAAHPLGLNAPIRGDSLYGLPEGRLFLHAEEISFLHPHTQQRVTFSSPAPF